MTQFPTLKPRKLIKIIQKFGFEKVRQEGSHIFFKHPDGRTTVIPFIMEKISVEDFYEKSSKIANLRQKISHKLTNPKFPHSTLAMTRLMLTRSARCYA